MQLSITCFYWKLVLQNMPVGERDREKLNLACPINCPPKTFPNFGASGKVIPRNMFTLKGKNKVESLA